MVVITLERENLNSEEPRSINRNQEFVVSLHDNYIDRLRRLLTPESIDKKDIEEFKEDLRNGL